MSKIVKKKDLDILIEDTMSKIGIKKPIVEEMDNKDIDTEWKARNDYYVSFGDSGDWFDEQDHLYKMEDGDWDESEYATWDEYVNSPYGSLKNKWSINPSTKRAGWDPEKTFNKYVSVHGPMKIRKRDTKNQKQAVSNFLDMNFLESKSNKKPLINENIQKELDLFNKLSNYTFKK